MTVAEMLEFSDPELLRCLYRWICSGYSDAAGCCLAASVHCNECAKFGLSVPKKQMDGATQ